MEPIQTIDNVVVDGETKTKEEGVYVSTKNKYKRIIMYICNGKQCGDKCSIPANECKHTTNLKYAAHYMSPPPNKRLEKSFDKQYMIMDEPCEIFIEKE